MQYGLIDEYWYLSIQYFFAKGIALFPEADYRNDLKLIKTQQIANGEVAIHYEVKHKS